MALLPHFHPSLIEAGCDEAGRGCLSGPVVAAAVILPRDFEHPLLNDSKQLSATMRDELRPIIEQEALAYSVQAVSVEEIDSINILNASIRAMHLAVDALSLRPELLLIDGNRFHPYFGIPHQCIVQGDAIYQSIAAASVLAKTYRDAMMIELHEEFPEYNWRNNKGYATADHRGAIMKHGHCQHHRKSFKLKALQNM